MRESDVRNGPQIAKTSAASLSLEWGPPLDVCEKIKNIITSQAPPAQYRERRSGSRLSGSNPITVDTATDVDYPPQIGSRPSRHRLRIPNLDDSGSNSNTLRSKVDFSLREGLTATPSSKRCSLKLQIKNDLFMSRLCYPRWWIENGDCKHLPNSVQFGQDMNIHLEGTPGESLQGLLSYVIYDMPYLPPAVFTNSMATLMMGMQNQYNPIQMFPREVLPPPFGTIFPKCFVNANIRREQDKSEEAKSQAVEEAVQTRVIIMWSVHMPKDPGSWMTRMATPRRLDLDKPGHQHGHSRNISTLSDLSFESLENLNRFAVTFVHDTEDLSLNPDLFQDILESKGAIAELEQSQTTNEIYEATATMGNGPICDLCVNFQDIMVDTSTLLPEGQDIFGRSETDIKPVSQSKMVKLEDVMSFLQPAKASMFGQNYNDANTPSPRISRSRQDGPAEKRPVPPRLRSLEPHASPGDAFKTVSPMFSPRRVSQTNDHDIGQGDRVLLENSRRGQVKVVAQHEKWGYGTWYCVRLTEPRGNNDGSWKGIRAFSCPPRYGVMVKKGSIVQKLVEASFDFMNEQQDVAEDDPNAAHKQKDEFVRIQEIWNGLTPRPHGPISFKQFAEVVKESEEGLTRSELRGLFNRIDPHNTNQLSFERFTHWYNQRKVEKLEENREAEEAEREARLQEYKEQQIKGVGSAPRTVVVRNAVRPMEEHDGYSHIEDAIELQEDGRWKAAIKKYDIGISMLEVQLLQIDRGMEKRKWKEKLEEFRHKRARCQREVAMAKRKKQLAERDKTRKKHAKEKARQEDKKIQKEIQETFRKAAGTPGATNALDDIAGMGEDGKIGEESSSSSDDAAPAPPTRSRSTRRLKDEKSKKKPKEKKLSAQEQELHDRISSHVVDDAMNVSFKDVMGLENVKLALYESIILPNLRPDLFKNIQKPTTGLLLFGPPGNGKTMIAKCVASECDATFFSISAAAITSKWVGEAERIMRTLFQIARQRQPSIIFIDEIDSLLTARGGSNEHESSRRIKTEFLIQFDGVHGSEDAVANVVVIGATNLPQQLDDAVLRRFPKRIMVPNPDADARFGLIRLLMSKHKHALHTPQFTELSRQTEGYSCSDISQLCQDVVMGPIRELRGNVVSATANDIPPISPRHFRQSLQNIRASTPASSLKMYDKWNADYGSSLFLTVDVLPENMRSIIVTSEDEREEKKEEPAPVTTPPTPEEPQIVADVPDRENRRQSRSSSKSSRRKSTLDAKNKGLSRRPSQRSKRRTE